MRKYMSKKPRSNGFLIIFIIMALSIYISEFVKNSQTQKLPYSVFKQEVSKGNVSSLTFKGQDVFGSLKEEIQYKNKSISKFETFRPLVEDNQLLETWWKKHTWHSKTIS